MFFFCNCISIHFIKTNIYFIYCKLNSLVIIYFYLNTKRKRSQTKHRLGGGLPVSIENKNK